MASSGGLGKGCIIALAVVGGFFVLLVVGSIVAITFLGNAVEDSLDDGGIPGVFGGECVEFAASYMTMSMMGFMTAGADESQQAEVQEMLDDLREIAPSEIEDEIVIVADAFGDAMGIVLIDAGPGGEPSAAAEAEATAILEDSEVLEAQDEIDAWVEANCG